MAFDPDQFPEAEQASALPVDQVIVAVVPTGVVVGDDDNVMLTGVGLPGLLEPVTLTAATPLWLPPAPEHESTKAYSPGVVSWTIWVPESGVAPFHDPEAVQLEAFVAVQVSVVV